MRFTSILVIIVFSVLTEAENPAPEIVVCPMVPQYILDFFNSKFNIEEADLSICKILMVFDNDDKEFFFVRATGIFPTEKPIVNDFKPMIDLRQKYPHLKLTLGKDVVNYFKTYMKFVNENIGQTAQDPVEYFFKYAVHYIKSIQFDGLNLNFNDLEDALESLSDIKPVYESKENQVIVFMKALNKYFKANNLLVTMSFTAETQYFTESFNLLEFVDQVDWIIFNPTRMDFPNEVFNSVAIQYAKIEFQPSNIRWKIDELINSGVEVSKIVLGIEMRTIFGRTFGSIDQVELKGYVGYNKLCEYSSDTEKKWERTYDEDTKLHTMARPYLDTKPEKEVYLFKTSRTVRDDVKFIRSRKLAGVSIYPLSMDDFMGDCSRSVESRKESENYPIFEKEKFPFLSALKKALLMNELEEDDEEGGDGDEQELDDDDEGEEEEEDEDEEDGEEEDGDGDKGYGDKGDGGEGDENKVAGDEGEQKDGQAGVETDEDEGKEKDEGKKGEEEKSIKEDDNERTGKLIKDDKGKQKEESAKEDNGMETVNQNEIVNKENQTNQVPSSDPESIKGISNVSQYSVGILTILLSISILF